VDKDFQSQFDAIERDRKRRERDTLLLLLLYASRAQRLIVGHLRDAGDDATELDVLHPKMSVAVEPLQRAQAEAWAQAHKRVGDISDEDLIAAGLLAIDSEYYDQALPLFEQPARDIVSGIAGRLSDVARQAVADKFSGENAADVVRKAFVAGGWTAREPSSVDSELTGKPAWAVRTEATDAIIKAYNGGFYEGMEDPRIKVKLTAYRHVSVLDDRTSDICRERGMILPGGITLPIFHSYWNKNWAPLHFLCRSMILPCFGEVEFSTVFPVTQAEPGWGYRNASGVERMLS
jgi:hypothetical protein